MINNVRTYPIHRETLGFKRDRGIWELRGWLLFQNRNDNRGDRSSSQPLHRQPASVGAASRVWLEPTASSSLSE